MKKLLLLLATLGLLVPGISWSDDLFGIAANSRGAPRYTVNKFGFNVDVEATEESIWDVDDLPTNSDGPVRCFANMNSGTTPTAAALYISSDDENDASDNDGISIVVEYLDADWDLASTTVALGLASASGTVFAQIGSATIMRVNRAYAAGAAPSGNIYIGKDDVDGGTDGVPDTIATDAVAAITIGENQTRQACYSVPNGYNAFMTNWCFSNEGTGDSAVTFRIRSSINGAAARVQILLDQADEVATCNRLEPPLAFEEKTDIEITGVASSDAGAGTFDLVLIRNTLTGLGE